MGNYGPTDCRQCKKIVGRKKEIADGKFRTEWFCTILQKVIISFDQADYCPHS